MGLSQRRLVKIFVEVPSYDVVRIFLLGNGLWLVMVLSLLLFFFNDLGMVESVRFWPRNYWRLRIRWLCNLRLKHRSSRWLQNLIHIEHRIWNIRGSTLVDLVLWRVREKTGLPRYLLTPHTGRTLNYRLLVPRLCAHQFDRCNLPPSPDLNNPLSKCQSRLSFVSGL